MLLYIRTYRRSAIRQTLFERSDEKVSFFAIRYICASRVSPPPLICFVSLLLAEYTVL